MSMVHDPLSPSEALRTRTGIALVAFGIFNLAYAVIIIGQLLVGLLFFLLPGGLYLTYRLFAVLDSIADAAQRFAAVREREADEASGGARFDRPVGRERSETETRRSAERTTERER